MCERISLKTEGKSVKMEGGSVKPEGLPVNKNAQFTRWFTC